MTVDRDADQARRQQAKELAISLRHDEFFTVLGREAAVRQLEPGHDELTRVLSEMADQWRELSKSLDERHAHRRRLEHAAMELEKIGRDPTGKLYRQIAEATMLHQKALAVAQERQLDHLERVLKDILAVANAGGFTPLEPKGYAASRRDIALVALAGMHDLLTVQGIDLDLDALLAQARGIDADSITANVKRALAEIQDLRAKPDRGAEWLWSARTVCGRATDVILTAAIALAATTVPLLILGQPPTLVSLGIDLAKTAISLLVAALCWRLRTDLPALWRQPDPAPHLHAIHADLCNRMADFDASFAELANRRTVNAPTDPQVTNDLLSVERAAYHAASLAEATEGWRLAPSYSSTCVNLIVLCRRATPFLVRRDGDVGDQPQAADLTEIIRGIRECRAHIQRYRIPENGEVQFRNEAHWPLRERLAERFREAGQLHRQITNQADHDEVRHRDGPGTRSPTDTTPRRDGERFAGRPPRRLSPEGGPETIDNGWMPPPELDLPVPEPDTTQSVPHDQGTSHAGPPPDLSTEQDRPSVGVYPYDLPDDQQISVPIRLPDPPQEQDPPTVGPADPEPGRQQRTDPNASQQRMAPDAHESQLNRDRTDRA